MLAVMSTTMKVSAIMGMEAPSRDITSCERSDFSWNQPIVAVFCEKPALRHDGGCRLPSNQKRAVGGVGAGGRRPERVPLCYAVQGALW